MNAAYKIGTKTRYVQAPSKKRSSKMMSVAAEVSVAAVAVPVRISMFSAEKSARN